MTPRIGAVIVSLHDVHPSTDAASRELLDMVDAHNLCATLLVVPGRWNGTELRDDTHHCRWLRRADADRHEVAMHGCNHEVDAERSAARRNLRNRVLARGCAEFVDLDEPTASHLLARGLAAMTDAGLRPVGFTPPGWLASPGTIRALEAAGFAYTTSHGSMIDLAAGTRHRIPAVCQRPNSPLTAVGVSMVRRFVVNRVANRKPVRLALHPADVADPRLRSASEQLLDIATCAPSLTYRELLETVAPVPT